MTPHVVFTENADGLGVQISEWIQMDAWCPGPVAMQVNIYQNPIDPPVVFTVQSTLDDPNDPASPVPPYAVSWFNCGDVNFVNASAPAQTYYMAAPRYIRLVQTAGKGIAQLTVCQNGSTPY
jgi:hypothetical protein